MIKLTVKGFKNSEFKNPKNVYLWVSFDRKGANEINARVTFHESQEEAETNTYKVSNKDCQFISGIASEFNSINIDTIKSNGKNWNDCEKKIHKLIADKIESLELDNISKVEVI